MTHLSGGDLREHRYRKLVELGIALSSEHHHPRLMENILAGARELAEADGGTLYLLDGDSLRFEILLNTTLKLAMGGTTGTLIPFPPLPLKDDKGNPNLRNVATFAAITGKTINVADAYSDEDEFDFSGTKRFDAMTGYRSRSFLTVPMKDNAGKVSGVLQLINHPAGGAFPDEVVSLVEALASQAAVALDNHNLLLAQKRLLESFIKVIAAAIDAKSPYTGGHCQRVPVLTEMLTRAAVDQRDGPFADFTLDEDGWYELHIAAWLHDCGKVTTPEYVVDKSTKLETIYDRIETVRTRFAVLKRDAELAMLQGLLAGGHPEELRARRDETLRALDDDLRFLESINLGGEFMAPEKLERLRRIAALRWRDDKGVEGPLLSEDEVRNLSVARGTLTDEERQIINDHIVQTIRMLEQLPFPDHMKNVVEYAGGHHEKMDGSGYPKGLTREQLSVPARIMAIADIFEALTAADRPYKQPKTLSETIRIMSFMKKDGHVDPDLFELFLTSGVYRQYAEKFLRPEQIDEVDVAQYVGR